MLISFLPVSKLRSVKYFFPSFLSLQEIFTSKDLAEKVSAHTTPTCTHSKLHQIYWQTRGASWTLTRKFLPPTTQRQGGQERHTRCRSPNENNALQPSTEESRICSCLPFPSSLPPLAARGMIYTSLRAAPQWGRSCCLLILSFTYNRRVQFTNRIQNSRRFIMSLLRAITNAAGRLPWLPLCRLLPGLRRSSGLPPETRACRTTETKASSRIFCQFY